MSLVAAGLLVLSLSDVDVAAAQDGKLTGVVTDGTTGEPLAGAQVSIAGTGLGGLTGENGRFFILNVPPGAYTVVAQLIGYQTVRRDNVLIAIDVTRTVNFELAPQAVAVEEIRVEAERVRLVETSATGASDAIRFEDVRALPVTDITGVLALRSGFLELPQNTDVVSLTEERRGISPVRIRGGRQGETLTLIDGIPVNNFVFGGPALDVTQYAIQQLDYVRGGFEPQYGNALSGIINIATRHGGTELAGAMEYQTSAVGGVLGSRYDELLDSNIFQGFLAGPVPGTDQKLRFTVAGRSTAGRDRVLEFDDEVFNPLNPTPEFGFNQPLTRDLFVGWEAFGFDQKRDVLGKLTYLLTPTAKLSATLVDYQRQRQQFDFQWLLGGFNASDECTGIYADRELCDFVYGGDRFDDMVQYSVRLDRRLYALNWDHTLGRTFYKVSVGRFDQERETCNFFQGICLEERFADRNFTEAFQAPGVTIFHPTSATDEFFGGEDMRTWVGRGDVQSQLTDHHNMQFGGFYQRHRLSYEEARDRGINDVFVVYQRYKAEPWDAAFYIQDRIEYDFLTVRLGFRFDIGRAGGLFFANPLDPTNATTAFDVCDNPTDPRWQNAQVRTFDGEKVVVQTMSADPTWTRSACALDQSLLQEAALIASSDDFSETSLRKQFSPRIGVSFPVTASSSIFFNFGRFSQNPLYNNLYQNTGVGTAAEGTPEGPILFSSAYTVPFLGNPNLLIEQTTSYEVGFLAELGEDYGLSLILFSKDQFGLTGIRQGGVKADGSSVFDPGVTYGTNSPRYSVLLNQDFQTSRGIEIGFRRRLTNYWAFDLNYSFSQSTTNAAPPERQFEREIGEGDPQQRIEIISEVDQPHVFNGSLRFEVGAESPLEGAVGDLLKHSALSFVVRAASGLPYTPQRDFVGGFGGATLARNRLDPNSGRPPSTFQIDLQASKDWRVQNLRYGLFFRVVNLTDAKNCVQVFTTTGNCESGAFTFLRRRVGNPVGEASSSTLLNRPHYVGARRSLFGGLRVSF